MNPAARATTSGKNLAVNNTTEGLRWRHQDHLGSLRVKTDSTGAVKCRHWYYPYGELWSSTCSEADVRRFTDKERDPESGLDYFGARHSASPHGRFTSVDPGLESGRLEDPQSWNRYAYVRNNPLRYVDLDGEDIEDFIKGVANGATSSFAFNIGRIDASSRNTDFAVGQILGDTLAAVGGGLEVLVGTGGTGGGAAATVTGVGAPVGVPVTAASVALAAHGAAVTTNAAANGVVGLTNPVFRKGGGAEKTPHGEKRAAQARAGDTARDVGDANRVIREGRSFRDSKSGHTVHVSGNRVVITDSNGKVVSQFKNTRANTQKRIQSGRWEPIEE